MTESVGIELLSLVLRSPRLPTLPAVALQVIELAQQPEVTIDSLAETISNDPALAAKILRTSNSSFYAQAREITTINQAVMILGLNSVRTLALGFSLVDNLRKSERGDFDYVSFWQRSLLTATAARAVAASSKHAQPEEAFLGGLLHRLGMLAMSQVLTDRYSEVVADAHDDGSALASAEDARFGLTHHLVGEALCERWNLPARLSACLRYYVAPDGAPDESRSLVRTVAVGADAAQVLLDVRAGESLRRFRERSSEWFQIDEAESELLLERVQADSDAMRKLFDLPELGGTNVSAILGRANEALTELNMELVAEGSRLEQRTRTLAVDATTDGLTGLSNRRFFDEFLRTQFESSIRYHTPLTLLFLDLDHFKRINDTYGHLTGDRVLAQVAAALRAGVRASDVLARYGGEEFAILMPMTELGPARDAAERLRAAVAQVSVDVGEGRSVSPTVSIGVAALIEGEHQRPDDLLRSADVALYSAKAAGRNRVLVAGSQDAAEASAA